MGVYHGNDLRKITGGRKGRHVKVKRKYLMGRFPILTLPGEEAKIKIVRTRGGNIKVKLKTANYANVVVPGQGAKKVKILKVLSNPASRDFERRGVITRGAIIQTELGKAVVTSRPGQDGVVNAVLLAEETE